MNFASAFSNNTGALRKEDKEASSKSKKSESSNGSSITKDILSKIPNGFTDITESPERDETVKPEEGQINSQVAQIDPDQILVPFSQFLPYHPVSAYSEEPKPDPKLSLSQEDQQVLDSLEFYCFD